MKHIRRVIPPTIASQHPDNAFAPFWDEMNRPFIGAYREVTEAIHCYRDLEINEYMWDWEGKHADAAVVDRLLSDHYDYFSKNQLGKDKFLTFRIPNIWEEKGYNLMQAMSVILSAEDMARDLKLATRPLFEIILPMTMRAEQLIEMQILFQKLAKFKSKEFTTDRPANNDYIEMIPLVEGIDSQLGVKKLLSEYIKLHEKHFNNRPDYLRVFFAGSDSSLTSGQLSGILANKLLLTRLSEYEEESGIGIFPFAGLGSLRFRGGLSPDTIDRFLKEYAGVRTVTLQSSFRYDHPRDKVEKAIARLEKELKTTKAPKLDKASQKRLEDIITMSTGFYRETVYELADYMQPVFKAVPKRRDRRQHIGLLAYSRNLDGHELPRAITFTAGFYSIGVPPELIGLGRTLQKLSQPDIELLLQVYPSLKADMQAVGGYLSKNNLQALELKNPAWGDVIEDVSVIESILGIDMNASTPEQKRHQSLSSQLLIADPEDYSDLIDKSAGLRRSLG